MAYVDGFVFSVSNDKKQDFIEYAKSTALVFKEYGATSVRECWGDDVPDGKVTSFPMAVKCEANETVCFSWIVWPSKQAREEGMKKCMEDPRFAEEMGPMPLDGKRMIFGSFEVVVAE
jgi:uncharacterized protein YbaA (DUF1428 family)